MESVPSDMETKKFVDVLVFEIQQAKLVLTLKYAIGNILVSGFSRRRRPEFASTSQNVARAT